MFCLVCFSYIEQWILWAICHRAINPGHILVFSVDTAQGHSVLQVKLTGFQSSIIYYTVRYEDIHYQPCAKWKRLNETTQNRTTIATYQAPEVFGDSEKESFDPVAADVWSYGATLYHFLTNKYPYDTEKNNAAMENEIQRNVRALGSGGTNTSSINRESKSNGRSSNSNSGSNTSESGSSSASNSENGSSSNISESRSITSRSSKSKNNSKNISSNEMHQNRKRSESDIGLSEQGQNLLGHCLTVYSTKRLTVDQISFHPWLKEYIRNG